MEWSCNSYVQGDASRNERVETEVLQMLQPHTNLKGLIIRGFQGSEFPDWIGDSSFSKMVDIKLEDCKNCTSLPSLGKLHSLKTLHIRGMNAVKKVGCKFYGEDCNKPFPLLQTLRFVNMPEWEEWFTFAVDTEVQAFTSLGILSMQKCCKLAGTLPGNLPRLKTHEIDNCTQLLVGVVSGCRVQPTSLPMPLYVMNEPKSSSLTSLELKDFHIPDSLCNPSTADKEMMGNAMLKHMNSVTYLSLENIQKLAFLPGWLTQGLMGLKELRIEGCKELTTLWNNEVRLDALQKLEIRECPQFVSLFEEEEAQGLVGCMPRLEYLEIWDCGKLEKLPQGLLDTSLRKLCIRFCMSLEFVFGRVRESDIDNTNLQELDVLHCPSLRYLINKGGLPPTLKRLDISGCAKLEALVAEEGMKINCPSLERVMICSCKNVKYLPDVQHNNNLRNLSRFWIRDCENLESVPEGWIHPTSTNLRGLCIRECEKVEVLPLPFLQKNILTSLEDLGTFSCSGFLDKVNFLANLTTLHISASKIGKPPSEWGCTDSSLLNISRLVISRSPTVFH